MLSLLLRLARIYSFFFFNDTATTEIYTLSLHDALPIYPGRLPHRLVSKTVGVCRKDLMPVLAQIDRKSTRLNSSHGYISYAVFCLKKKNKAPCTTVRAAGLLSSIPRTQRHRQASARRTS